MTPTFEHALHGAFLGPALAPRPSSRDLFAFPHHPDGIPCGTLRVGRHAVRFARHRKDLEAVQALRFQVFNVELDEGHSGSFATGLDQDPCDAQGHHLMVLDTEDDTLVATCRLTTAELAQREQLSAFRTFDLTGLPDHVLRHGAEVGRICCARGYRDEATLEAVWRGIARYLDWNDKRHVLGRVALSSLEPGEIAAFSRQLARLGLYHDKLHAPVRPWALVEHAIGRGATPSPELPPAFASYLRLGARVCAGPALDEAFGVTDYLLVLDLRDVPRPRLAELSAPGLWRTERA